MVGHIQGKDRFQEMYTTTRLEDYVKENSICRVIDAFVDSLDLKTEGFENTQPQYVGRPAFDPGDLLKLYIYGYLYQLRSSRRLQREAEINQEVMWLIKGLTPDDRTLCYFFANNTEAIKKVFRDFNKKCLALGLFGREMVSIDGTKTKADNSRKNYYTKDDIEKKIEKLDSQITTFIKEMEENDRNDADEEKVEDANITSEILEAFKTKKEKLEEVLKEIDENEGNPVCTVDKDAALMKLSGGKGFDICYNVQTAVDSKNGLVVDFYITNNCNDMAELSQMAGCAKDMLEAEELVVLADTGYSNGKEIDACEKDEITCYIPKPKTTHQPENEKYHRDNFKYDAEKDQYTCPEGNTLDYVRTRERNGNRVYANRPACMSCPSKDKCTKADALREIERNPYQESVDRANENAKGNPDIYQRRQMLSEHPFGVIKQKWKQNQYTRRGKEKVKGETALSFLAFNLRRAVNILGTKTILEALV